MLQDRPGARSHLPGKRSNHHEFMILRTFKIRLLIWTAGLLLAGLAVSFVLVARNLENQYMLDAEAASLQKLGAVDWLLRHGPQFENHVQLDAWATELGQRLGVRISYIAEGHVLADSGVSSERLSGLDDHSGRPEVIEALAGGTGVDLRTSHTLGQEMLYVARKVEASPGLPGGVLRLAVPFSDLAAQAALARSYLFWAFGTALAATILLGLLLSRMLMRSINTFTATARDIGQGDYARRIREVPGGEFEPLAEAINAMAKEIEHHVATLTEQQGQLAAMFEGMTEGVLVLDAEGRIVSCNKAWQEMFPAASGPVGLTPLEATRRLEIQDLTESLVGTPSPGVSRGSLELEDHRALNMSGVPYQDQHRETKIIVVFHDVTEARRSEEALKTFVANVSHQLRTPLTSIRGYAETLRDNPPQDRQAAERFLDIIGRNAKHMDSIVSSMLALAKSERAGATAELEPVSLRVVLANAVADLEPLAANRDIHLVTDHAPDIELLAEPQGLLHVLHNLLHNALKHAPDGSTIEVRAACENGEAVVCVLDQGPGIPLEHAQRVFEPFYRVDPNPIDDQGGAGLGLAICRRIMRSLDGDIWLERPASGAEGSSFCFRLKTADQPPASTPS